ncbi:hypothetical protein F5Y18DRAFT_369103 [Xylariaceae sp. FL1019]|nr:hypothetical protein F5Y18DRAFT_369103 [Xylariaceae sp. FL1019]
MEGAERLESELELLLAMYPESLSYSDKARELRYSYLAEDPNSRAPATLILRLPDSYPLEGFPEVILATDHQKEDLRSDTKAAFQATASPTGEEVLDALLLAFQELVSSHNNLSETAINRAEHHEPDQTASLPMNKTVIIWLHHLLATGKRKLALNPSMGGSKMSGITKPGYPGVMIFSGERSLVDAHVSELRNQRWQAFQVRFDSDDLKADSEPWQFGHGAGIREVESMSEITQNFVDDKHRETFLDAIGIK